MKRQAAFSLVEVTLALGIIAFCLVGLFGLLPVAMNSNRVSLEECNALNVMNRLVASLRALPASRPADVGQWVVEGLTVPNAGDAASTQTLFYSEDASGQFSTREIPDAVYRLTVTTTPPPGGGAGNAGGAVSVYLRATWPAHADPAGPGVGSVACFTALERK